jgi:hypothetical protein
MNLVIIAFSIYSGTAASLFVAVFWTALVKGEDEGPAVMLSLAIGICWPLLVAAAVIAAVAALFIELSRPFRRIDRGSSSK